MEITFENGYQASVMLLDSYGCVITQEESMSATPAGYRVMVQKGGEFLRGGEIVYENIDTLQADEMVELLNQIRMGNITRETPNNFWTTDLGRTREAELTKIRDHNMKRACI